MARNVATQKSLAEAVTKVVDSLHNKYSGIKIQSISNYEDEDFTLEITIPEEFPFDQVEEVAHTECIKVEDEYNLYIFPKIIRKAGRS